MSRLRSCGPISVCCVLGLLFGCSKVDSTSDRASADAGSAANTSSPGSGTSTNSNAEGEATQAPPSSDDSATEGEPASDTSDDTEPNPEPTAPSASDVNSEPTPSSGDPNTEPEPSATPTPDGSGDPMPPASQGGTSDEPEPVDPEPNADAGEPQMGPAEQGIRIDGRRLIVDGEVFQIRGVNWNPVPKGGSHPGDLDYAGFADQDIALMKAAGINAVRTYERLEDPEVLDKLYAAGIYVMSTVYGWWQDDPSVVTERVNAAKDHPAILGWVLGNEWNYNKLYGNDSLSVEQARDQINAAAALIKALDPDHPIASIYGEVGGIDAMVEAMPDIDVWGVNAYRGIDFGDLFSRYAELSDKPLFLGEYGADAFNADLGAYDPESQGEATRVLTQSILDNSTLAGGVISGGFVFEWADEWWKVSDGDLSAQDNGGVAPGGGPYPDGVFNEEWWGIVDIDRNPRPAYEALKALYAE